MIDGLTQFNLMKLICSKTSILSKKTCTERKLLGGGGLGILKCSEIGVRIQSHTDPSRRPLFPKSGGLEGVSK